MEYEYGLSEMRKYLEDVEANNRNEDTTRFQLIDRLLLSCLGWNRAHIQTEIFNQGERTDYELGSPSKLAVVEAKREGIYFELPAGFSKVLTSLQVLRGLSTNIKEAIDQAIGYCQTRGIAVGAIANGHQIIIFLGSRADGIPVIDGKALVFGSIQLMVDNFHYLWDALSSQGLKLGRTHALLSGKETIPPPAPLSRQIPNYPGYKNRNPLAAELQILGGVFLEDLGKNIEFEEDFVQETYCNSGALSQYSMVSREILTSRYAAAFEKGIKSSINPVRTKKGLDKSLTDDLFAASVSRRPIVLVGDVGVGKSMFIKHLIYVDARDQLEDAIVLLIDFGSKPTVASDISGFVQAEFKRQLLSKHNIDIDERNFIHGVYHRDLERFEKGIYGELRDTDVEEFKKQQRLFLEQLIADRDEHLLRSLTHIAKGQNHQVVIFLDNVDQRPLDFQEQVFLLSESIASNWPAVVFIALRPETFAYSKRSGAIKAYQPRVFSIAPPRIDRVIQNRLMFALKNLKQTGQLGKMPRYVSLSSSKLVKYIEMIYMAFNSSHEINEFVDNMSNGNLRYGLSFIMTFVGSAHVDTDKIFEILDDQGSYYLPIHEFVRAIIHRDNEYYDPSDSDLPNIFRVRSNEPSEHFLIPLLLGFIDEIGRLNSEDGFIVSAQSTPHS
jgi:hypothetical protein